MRRFHHPKPGASPGSPRGHRRSPTPDSNALHAQEVHRNELAAFEKERRHPDVDQNEFECTWMQNDFGCLRLRLNDRITTPNDCRFIMHLPRVAFAAGMALIPTLAVFDLTGVSGVSAYGTDGAS